MHKDVVKKMVSLCKRRGFVFQSSEIYGGLKSTYDYGPLGVELKRNLANAWWQNIVRDRDHIVGIDAAIMMHPRVWETSGHIGGFSDPLVDCLSCQERFRADKAPLKTLESRSEEENLAKTTTQDHPYVCPNCGSSRLSDERHFNLMFRTSMGPIDALTEFIERHYDKALDKKTFQKKLSLALKKQTVYLRPETAQAIFVQFLNIQQSMGLKIPFGIAQQGKSFRNEIITEHFIFRSAEFEQMELEFFCEPGTQEKWLDYWKQERLDWYQQFANHRQNFRLRRHKPDELAHYSEDCYDIEYRYPWGWDELEGIASRTDYDLKRHSQATHTKLNYFDQSKTNPETGKPGWRYYPYVIEPAAGLTRAVFCFLLDAYTEESYLTDSGETRQRTVLKLDPKLAPIKAAILPLVKQDAQISVAERLLKDLKKRHLPVTLDIKQSIGKRYARHDEIGTVYAITIDEQSLIDQTVTMRDRDTRRQKRLSISQIKPLLSERFASC